MTVHSMFSVPIIHYEIANWPETKKRILDALPPVRDDMKQEGDTVFTDFFQVCETDEMPEYADVIIDIIKPYLADFSDQRKVSFTDMWFQTAYKGDSHGCHNHGHSGWSSVLYVEFDPRVHTATTFYSPFNNPWSGTLETFCPPVKEGDMIIFPATITHEAMPNKSDKKRTIVSYNLQGKVDTVKKTLWQGDPIRRVASTYAP